MKKYLISLAFALCGLLAFGQSVDIRPAGGGGGPHYTSNDNMASQFTPSLTLYPLLPYAECTDTRRGDDYVWNTISWQGEHLDDGRKATTPYTVTNPVSNIATGWNAATHNRMLVNYTTSGVDTFYIDTLDVSAQRLGEVFTIEFSTQSRTGDADTVLIHFNHIWKTYDGQFLTEWKCPPRARIQMNFQVHFSVEGGTLVEVDDILGSYGHSVGGGGSVAGSDKQVQFNDGGVMGANAGLTFDKTAAYLQSGSSTEYVRLFKDSIDLLNNNIPTLSSGKHRWMRFNLTPAVSSAYAYAPFGFVTETTPNALSGYANAVWSMGPNTDGNSGTAIVPTKPTMSINWETSWESGGVPYAEWHETWKNPDSIAIRLKSYTITYRNGYNPTATPTVDIYHSADAFSVKSPHTLGVSYWAVARNRASGIAQMQLQVTRTNSLSISGSSDGTRDYTNFVPTSGGLAKDLTFSGYKHFSFSDVLGTSISNIGYSGFRVLQFGTTAVSSSFLFDNMNLNSGYRTEFKGDLTTTSSTSRGHIVVLTAASTKGVFMGTRSDISLGYISTVENLALRGAKVEIGSGTASAAPTEAADVILNSNNANTTANLSMKNVTVTTGLKTFVTNATPESAITGSPGDIAMSNQGNFWVKKAGSATNSQWRNLAADTVFITLSPLAFTDSLKTVQELGKAGGYFNVPSQLNGYTISKVEYSVIAAGSGTGSVVVGLKAYTSTRTTSYSNGNAVTFNTGDYIKTSTAGGTVATGQLIVPQITTDSIVTHPRGLTVLLMLTK